MTLLQAEVRPKEELAEIRVQVAVTEAVALAVVGAVATVAMVALQEGGSHQRQALETRRSSRRLPGLQGHLGLRSH